MHLGRALFESEQLFSAERFVMDLRSRLDEILQVSASEEISEVDEFAVSLIFDIDRSPAVLTTADSLTVHVDVVLATDNGEGDDGLGKN